MSLRILYITQYFPPETNAPANRVSELSRCWANWGNEVKVITAFPSHPYGIVPEKYRGRFFLRRECDGVTVLRTPHYIAANRGFGKRVISFLSFMFSATVTGWLASRRGDIVIATSPQFFTAVAGYVISRLRGIPFVFEVRDIWPEEVAAVGMMKRGLIFRLLESLEMFLYRQATLVVVVAQGSIEILVSRGVDRKKLKWVPNGVDLELFRPGTKENWVRSKYDLNGKFVVSYIGTHGMAQKLETILEAAKSLRDQRDLAFLFVGDGTEKEALVHRRGAWGLDNVLFVHQQPHHLIPDFLAASDVCVVPLRKAELFMKNIPSKIYEIMACERPVIIGAEGESRSLVQRANAGIGYPPEGHKELSRCIMRLCSDSELLNTSGKNGLRFVRTSCSWNRCAGDYLSVLGEI